jgi:aspartate-semialdehyde dehydrogenase
MTTASLRVGVVGATGAVGRAILDELQARAFPVGEVRLFASSRTPDRTLPFRGRPHPVEPLAPGCFRGLDVVLASVPSSVSREWGPRAVDEGALYVDNSSAWRLDPNVCLAVPEVHGARLRGLRAAIVANPNCIAIPLTVTLAPLARHAKPVRVVVSTYQSSSGRGATGLAQLEAERAAHASGASYPPPTAHRGRLYDSVITDDWTVEADGQTEEERKIALETRKILDLPELALVATTVRVPVAVGHAASVVVELDRPVAAEEAAAWLADAPGVVLRTDRAPKPEDVRGGAAVHVGRLRADPSRPGGLAFWLAADNLRKGAATNAVQIAEAAFGLESTASRSR